MANEVFIPAMTPGDVVYVVEFNSTGQAWRPLSSAFVVYTDVRSDFVLHRTTIGANGNFGPFDAQSGTTRWLAFVTAQSSGNESASLDYSVWEEGVVRATDSFGNALATSAALQTVDDNVDAVLLDTGTEGVASVTGNVGGKVLGGGSGTITGTGARVVDASGNAVASQLQLSNLQDLVVIQAAEQAVELEAIQTAVGNIEGGSGTPRPVNQVPVPSARVWTLKPTDDGLQGELPLIATLGDDGKVWAIDFRHDLANNGRLLSIDAVTLVSGTTGGITFGNDINDVDDYGVDRSQTKVRIGLVQVGTYTIRVNVTYDDADGGGTSQGEVKLVVK